MSNPIVTLLLKARDDGAGAVVDNARKALGGLGSEGAQAGAAVENGMGRARRGVESISGQLQRAKMQFVGFIAAQGALQTVRGISRMADDWKSVSARLDLSTSSAVNTRVAMSEVTRVAQATGAEIVSTGDLVAKLTTNFKDMGRSSQTAFRDALGIASTINQAFAVSGTSTEAQKNAITQFTQALAGGTLRAEEFNSVVEASPRLARAMADGMNMSMGELRTAVNNGEVSAKRMTDALVSQAAVIESEYARAPLTIDRAWLMVRNSVMEYVGGVDRATSSSAVIAGVLMTVASNLGLIANAAVLAGGAWAGAIAGRAVSAALKLVQTTVAVQSATVGSSGAFAAQSVASTAAAGSVGRYSVATLAATVATRGLAAALAFLSSATGIGLIITGLALAINAIVSWNAEAKRTAQEGAKAAQDAFEGASAALGKLNAHIDAADWSKLVDADVPRQMAEMTRQLEALQRQKQAHDDTKFIYESQQSKRAYANLSAEIETLRNHLIQLTPQYDQAATAMAKQMLTTAGATNASNALIASVTNLIKAKNENRLTDAAYDSQLKSVILSEQGADVASRAAAQGIMAQADAAKAAAAESEWYSSKLDDLIINLERVKNGQIAAFKMQAGMRINARAEALGKDIGGRDQGLRIMAQNGELRQAGEGILSVTRMMEANDKAQAEADARARAQSNARSAARKSERDSIAQHKRDLRQNAQWDDKAANAQDALNAMKTTLDAKEMGAVAKVEAEYTQALAKIAGVEKDLANAHRLNAENQALVTRARTAANEAHSRGLIIAQREETELTRKKDIVGNLVTEYTRETSAIGLNVREHAIAEAIIAANATAKQQYMDGQRESIELTQQETAALREQMGSAYDQRAIAETAQDVAQDFQRNWLGAIDAVNQAWDDFLFSGLRDWKSFGSALVDIGKQFLGNLLRQYRQTGGQMSMGDLLTTMSADKGSVNGFGASTVLSLGETLTGAIDKLSASNNSMLSSIGNLLGKATGRPIAGATSVGGNATATAGAGANGASALAMPPWMGAIAGGAWGMQRGGDGLLGRGMSLAAGTTAGIGLSMGIAGAIQGSAVAGAAAAGLAAIPVAGWIALGAIAVDKITGGKLFGTSYAKESSAAGFTVSGTGADGYTSVTESKQKALFGGKKYRTTTNGLDAQDEAKVDDMFRSISDAVNKAAAQLSIAAPDILAASYKQEFDKNGNLTRQSGTINGRSYSEDQESFVKRLVGENLLAVAKAVGSSTEIEQLADAYRSTGDELQGFAAFMLALQSDIKSGTALWDSASVSLTRMTEVVTELARAGETAADAYARIVQTATQYGALMADVETQLRTVNLNDYQRQALQIETAYRQQRQQANELAKSLGLAGARTEDLAKIEMLRAQNMAALQTQMEAARDSYLQDLSLSNLSTLRDDEKLAEAMSQFRTAIDKGDLQTAQQLSNVALSLGQSLYASGADYNALYTDIETALKGIQMPSLTLDDGTTMGDLAEILLTLPKSFATELVSMIATPAVTVNLPISAPEVGTPVAPPAAGGNGGSTPAQERTNELLGELVYQTAAQRRRALLQSVQPL